jgi:hypothetical protein
MQKIAASCLALSLAACSTGPPSVAAPGPNVVLVGVVVSSQEVSSFIGDREMRWYSHVVAPSEDPGARVTVLTGQSDCPAVGDAATVYRLSLRARGPEPIGLRHGQSAELVSDWVIASCQPIG